MRVAEAAVAAVRQHRALADLGEVGDQRLLVILENLRTERHLDHDSQAPLAPCRSLPMPWPPPRALKCC